MNRATGRLLDLSRWQAGHWNVRGRNSSASISSSTTFPRGGRLMAERMHSLEASRGTRPSSAAQLLPTTLTLRAS